MRNDVNLPQSLTVSYAFDPSVAKPATFGTDYSVVSSVGSMSSSGTITFPAGQRFIEAKLTPVLDNDPETEEIARLKLVANTTRRHRTPTSRFSTLYFPIPSSPTSRGRAIADAPLARKSNQSK